MCATSGHRTLALSSRLGRWFCVCHCSSSSALDLVMHRCIADAPYSVSDDNETRRVAQYQNDIIQSHPTDERPVGTR